MSNYVAGAVVANFEALARLLPGGGNEETAEHFGINGHLSKI
jgi:hypothetical protein